MPASFVQSRISRDHLVTSGPVVVTATREVEGSFLRPGLLYELVTGVAVSNE